MPAVQNVCGVQYEVPPLRTSAGLGPPARSSPGQLSWRRPKSPRRRAGKGKQKESFLAGSLQPQHYDILLIIHLEPAELGKFQSYFYLAFSVCRALKFHDTWSMRRFVVTQFHLCQVHQFATVGF